MVGIRGLILITAGALVLFGSIASGSAPKVPCGPSAAHTLLQAGGARIFSRPTSKGPNILACRTAATPRLLAPFRNHRYPGASARGPVRLSGDWAIGMEVRSGDDFSEVISSAVNLRTERRDRCQQVAGALA